MMQNLKVNRPLLASVVCVGIAGIVLFVPLPGLLAAIFTTSIGQEDAGQNMQAYLATHKTDLESYRQRFEGRSLFFRPPAPLKPAPKPTIVEKEPDRPPPEPIVPRLYAGPNVIAIIGDQVWFRDDLKLRVGEEGNGVKVLASNPPWTVRLAHAGGEYDVPIFEDYQTKFTSNSLVDLPTPGVIVADSADGPVKAAGENKREPSEDGSRQ